MSPGRFCLVLSCRLVDLDDPAFGSFDFAALDAGERLAQLGHDGAGLFHTADLDDLVVIGDLADGADDGCRAAQASLDEVAGLDLAHLDGALVDLHAEHVARDD